MLGAHGVPAPDDLFVRRPEIAGLRPDLLLYPRQGGAFNAAEPRGLVLDAEQDEVLRVFYVPTIPAASPDPKAAGEPKRHFGFSTEMMASMRSSLTPAFLRAGTAPPKDG